MLKSLTRCSWAFLVLSTACSAPIPDQLNSQFDFNKDAFTFNNFGEERSGGRMNAELAIRMFGEKAVCLNGDASNCDVSPGAKAWIDDVNALMVYGHSEGIAVLSQLVSMGKLSASDFGGVTGAGLSIENQKVTDELAYWAATQKVESVHRNDKSFEAKDVMPFLAENLKPDAKERFRLLIAMRDAQGFSGGHAVVPFGFFKGEKDGLYWLRIYDSNFPGTERRIEIDTKANTWKYEGSFIAETPRLYEGTPENKNRLYFSPVSERMGVLPAPFADDAPLMVSLSSGAARIEGGGVNIGFDEDGTITENGGRLLPGGAQCFDCRVPTRNTTLQANVDAGTLPKKVVINAASAYATDTVTVSGSGVTVTTTAGGGSVDIGAGGNPIKIEPAGGKNGPVKTTITTKDKNGRPVTVTVEIPAGSNSVTVDASDPNNVVVRSDQADGTTGQTVKVTVTSGGKTTTASGTANGKDVSVQVNPVTGTKTFAEVSDDLCLNGIKDESEGDVDCGQVCQDQKREKRKGDIGRCGIGKTCKNANDCQDPLFPDKPGPGQCIMGVCSAPGCSDGVKNGYESDVDCGVSQCLCPAGKKCTSSQNCGAGLVCDEASTLTCVAPKNHTLTVVGLPEGSFIDINSVNNAGSVVTQTYAGKPAGASFDVSFNVSSLYVWVSAVPLETECVFTTSVNGEWKYTGNVLQRNTLTCRRSSWPVYLKTTGVCQRQRTDAGCGPPLRASDGGQSIQSCNEIQGDIAQEFTFTTAVGAHVDTLPFNTVVPLGGVLNGNPLNYVEAVTLRTDAGVVAPGVAWRLTLGSPKEAESRWLYQDPTLPPYNNTRTVLSGRRYRNTCTIRGTSQGAFPANNESSLTLEAACQCSLIVSDAGVPVDAGVPFDAGVRFDAGMPIDAGMRFDAGVPVDAGMRFDAGMPFDAGVDAGMMGGPPCTLDNQCASMNCYCGPNSGNCAAASGRCAPGPKAVLSIPTNGVVPSGTFTVPANCSSVFVKAWGAAGGAGQGMGFMGFPGMKVQGGAGGFVFGPLATQPGDVLTGWIGNGGAASGTMMLNDGTGSYAGTPANGGMGDDVPGFKGGGQGGGLTSLKQTGSVTLTFSVPGGGGAGSSPSGLGSNGGQMGASGGAIGFDGNGADPNSTAGGGGAGENGGLAGGQDLPGNGGAFGLIPFGFIPAASSAGDPVPPQTSLSDYNLCPFGTAQSPAGGGRGGNGCIVLRCTSP